MADSEPDDADERRHRKGLKFRRRDDYAVELFREAQANLEDLQRVNRILLELGRFYNPYINAPIVDLATRRRIIELPDGESSNGSSGPKSRMRGRSSMNV